MVEAFKCSFNLLGLCSPGVEVMMSLGRRCPCVTSRSDNLPELSWRDKAEVSLAIGLGSGSLAECSCTQRLVGLDSSS